MEKMFDFRKKLCSEIYPTKFEKRERVEDEIFLYASTLHFIGECDSMPVRHAIDDLKRFLRVGGAKSGGERVTVSLKIDREALEDVAAYKGRIVEISEGKIDVRAFDERGLAEALYNLEDEMRECGTNAVRYGKRKNRPLFSPRMAHSAYDYDIFPDGYLQTLAREGFDAVTVYVKGENVGIKGEYYDFADLVRRAAGYGMDVYAYCVVSNFKHPSDPDAPEAYEAVYAPLFKGAGFKGIVFVGESVEFPSKDPRTTGRRYNERNRDKIPEGLPSPGWWPSSDYPEWITLIRDTIRKVSPGADLIFWTYNWGWAPKEEREALLRALPTDITLMVTFEMFEKYKVGDIYEMVCDYSLAIEGPGEYFVSEAKIAAERGIKLYTQANAAGRTWDFGNAPYEPMPGQWQKRYAALREAQDKYGLVGIMESHHYGVYPSFITKIEKKCYEYVRESDERILRDVVGIFSGGETDKCLEAFALWDEAIRLYPPNDEEQYCAMRIGPAYPLTFLRPMTPPNDLIEKVAGKIRLGITVYDYRPFDNGRYTPHCLRIRPEIENFKKMRALLTEGVKTLRTIKKKSRELLDIINLGEYMVESVTTNINVKRMFLLRTEYRIAKSEKRVREILKSARKIIAEERKNATRAIATVRRDSSLGYEATMSYSGGEDYIGWKLRHLDYVENIEFRMIENALDGKASAMHVQYME